MSIVKETTNDLLRIIEENSVYYVVPSMRPEPDTSYELTRNGQVMYEGADYGAPESPIQWLWRLPLTFDPDTDVIGMSYYPFGRRS